MASYATKLAIQLSDTSIEPEHRTHLFIPQLVERDSVADAPQG
jgi:LacI family transcriptional regulator